MTIKGNFEDGFLIHQNKELFWVYSKCEVHSGGDTENFQLSVIKAQVSLWKEWETVSNTK